jgi:hypothetical protein
MQIWQDIPVSASKASNNFDIPQHPDRAKHPFIFLCSVEYFGVKNEGKKKK